MTAGAAGRGRAALNWPAVASVVLIVVGAARLFSYSRATALGDFVRASPLGPIAYSPTEVWNAQYFKILATPSIVAMQYLLFRFLNRGAGPGPSWRTVDFRSPWLRLLLTSLATAHWAVIELTKFAHPEHFFPWSPIESRTVNFAVLLVGQALSFVGMKYLSFEPLRRAPDA